MSKKEEIQEFVGKFVQGLTKLMRDAAHETVDATFSDGSDGEDSKPARTVKSLRRASAPKQLPKGSSGGLEEKVLAAIKANPGCGGGLIKDETGLAQWQLGATLRDLASAGAIKKTGNGRGTRYTAR